MKKYYSLLCAATLVFGLGLYATTADAGKPVDADNDGYTTRNDCNDADAAINPGATEICDGIDNNCDGVIDEGCGVANKWVVMASNDLGMHCACPTSQYFLLLPPYNTLRAQVIKRDVDNVNGGTPTVVADNSIRVEYNIVENTDASLAADPYYQAWLAAAPTMFPGYDPAPGGVMTGLAGKGLYGDMDAQPEGWYEAVGIPAFPDVSSNSTNQEKIMSDPLGGPNRNPYLTGNVKVLDAQSGALLAETNATVPVAFGGCCACHIPLGGGDPLAGWELMGSMHATNSSGINIAQLDYYNASTKSFGQDGIVDPVRCSACHFDAAMGPGSDTGIPGLPKSQYTFSNVLHRWHVENPNVLAMDPDLANDCYKCHPGNGVNCYRGHHTNKLIGRKNNQHPVWCSDCHGDLNQRVAENQMDDAWSPNTLPSCTECHSNTGENNVLSAFGGSFLKSMSHKNDKILCSTCHGEPHGLAPSTLDKDNAQNIALQNDSRAIGVCNVCHVGRSDSYGVPMH